MWRITKHMTEDARIAVMLDGAISDYVVILQGVTKACTPLPYKVKLHMNELIVSVEAAKQGNTIREDTMSASTFADDFVGILETLGGLGGLQKQLEKALECTRILILTANVNKRAVVARNEDKLNPVTFKWK